MSLPGIAATMLIAAVATAAQAKTEQTGALVVIDEGAFGVPAMRTLQRLGATALGGRGVAVAVDERLAPHALDGDAARIATEDSASRLFALRVRGAVGDRVPLELEEVSRDGLSPIFRATLTATSLGESEKVLSRLVDAVLDRRAAAGGPQVSTVTLAEAQPYLKKPGERYWILGFPFGASGASGGSYSHPGGFFIGYGYETESWRVDLRLQAEGHGNGGSTFFGIAGSWLPLAGEVSPYLTLGIGYGGLVTNDGLSDHTATGVTATAEVGLELLRLHGTRLMIGAQAIVPLYSIRGLNQSLPIAPGAHFRVAF
jgi:hypothetical protein